MQGNSGNKLNVAILSVVAAGLTVLSLGASAQNADDGIEVMRNAADLRTVAIDTPNGPPMLNTAIVFTNQRGSERRVRCVAWSANGQEIGRAWTKLPGHGLRVMYASDVTNGSPFVGKITCRAGLAVHGSAFIIGAVFSPTDVTQSNELTYNDITVQAAVVH